NLQIQQATDQIQNTKLVSPINGVVSAVNVNAGEVVGPGRPLVSISGTTNLRLEASVPVRLLSVFRPGRGVTVLLDTVPGRKFNGIIREVSPVANPDGRSYPARIDLTNPPDGLRPGARARVSIQVPRERRTGGGAETEPAPAP